MPKQRKVAELENVVKTLETTLTEQSAMIRILRSNQSASAIDSALTDAATTAATAGANGAVAAANANNMVVDPTSPTHQLLQLHQRQLSASYLHPSSALFQQQQQQHQPPPPNRPPPFPTSVSAASTPTHHLARHHLNPSSPAASAAIVDYLRNAGGIVPPLGRSRSPSAGLNVSHADILHANLIHDNPASSPLHSKSLMNPPPPPLSIFTSGGGGGSLHVGQARQLQFLRRSATPTAELMRPGAGAMTLPAPIPQLGGPDQRRDSAPSAVLAALSPGTT